MNMSLMFEYFLRNTGLKTEILQRMYELISTFATQRFCSI